ncbi:MAG TPA: hypothetical protein VJ808_13170 [Gemmatimonadales bacterium]|nr:hypothetical protein [Gemmatimonadales bacterium]
MERSSLPKPEDPCTCVEPERLEALQHRLHQGFYDQPEPSERIAAAVLVDLKTFDESSPVVPH